MPSNNIESRFSAVLQSIAQSILPNYSCLFGSWDDVDRLLDHATYPAILNILSVSGGGFFRHGRVYERESILLAFVDVVPRDADGTENINAVDRMRSAMRTFVSAINASGVFVPIASYNYTTIYESGANIHTGVMVELTLEDANGTCGDNLDPSSWHIPMGQMVDLTSYLLKEDANAIYATKSSIPSLIGYATERWVQNQGFLTEHQSLDGYATEIWVNGQGFVNQDDLAGYATQEWVRQQGYMSGGVLPLAFTIGVNITDSTLIAKWDEMMAEAQTKGNTNVSPFAYFVFSKQTGMGSWNTFNSGYIQSDCNSIRFDDWVVEKQSGELTIYYKD